MLKNTSYWKQKANLHLEIRHVAKLGFEPRQTEPESVVLPLHHLAISNIRLSVNGNRISIRLTSRGALEYELSYQ